MTNGCDALDDNYNSTSSNEQNKDVHARFSFRQSVLSMIPGTRSHRKALEQIRCMKDEEDAAALGEEEDRVRQIQLLIDCGRHDTALKQLLADTDTDLRYLNRLKHGLENGDNSSTHGTNMAGDVAMTEDGHHDAVSSVDTQNAGSDDKAKASTSISMDQEQMISATAAAADTCRTSKPNFKKCRWLGVDRSKIREGQKYVCTNPCIAHPRKICSSVYGDIQRLQLDFCSFHARYCIDPDSCHPDNLVEIQNPNEFALCNGCYVQSCCRRPPTGVRIPGRRPLTDDNDRAARVTSTASSSSVKVTTNKSVSWKGVHNVCCTPSHKPRHKGTFRATGHLLSETLGAQRRDRVTSARMKQSLAFGPYAVKIQKTWRRYVARSIFRQRREKAVVRKRMVAATKIQVFFKSIQSIRNMLASIRRISFAAVVICRVCRGFIARRDIRMIRSAAVVQRAWRIHLLGKEAIAAQLRCKELISEATRKSAAIVLQRWARSQIREQRWRRFVQPMEQESVTLPTSHVKPDDTTVEENTCSEECSLSYSDEDSDTTTSDTSAIVGAFLSSKGGDKAASKGIGITCTDGSDPEPLISPRHVNDKALHVVSQCPDTDAGTGNDTRGPDLEVTHSFNRLDEKLFSQYDANNKGSLTRHDFARALSEIWNSEGAVLLKPELNAIINICDRYHTGHVNYRGFIRFKKRQRAPCQAHSRLLCAECIILGGAVKGQNGYGCQEFIPSSSSASIRRECGRCSDAHEILPRPLEPRTNATGRGIISQKEMEQVFRQKRVPDLSIPPDIKFVRLSSSGRPY